MGFPVLVLRRLRSHPIAVAAVAATVLLSTLVVGTLQVFSGAVADGAASSAVVEADLGDQSIAVEGAMPSGGFAEVQEAVTATARQLGDGATVLRWALSPSYGLPDRPENEHVRLADVAGIADAVEIVDGEWPTPPTDGGPVPVAISEATAEELGWSVGTTVRLSQLIQEESGPRVEVVGVWRPDDPQDPVWADNPFEGAGVIRTDFTTFGPLVVADGAFAGPVGEGASGTWRIVPDFSGLSADTISEVRSDVDRAIAQLAEAPALKGMRVSSGLPQLLTVSAETSAAATTALLTPGVLLLMLAAVALVLGGTLLATLREGETLLLRARGASGRQVASLGLWEGLLVVVPSVALALLLGPVLAGQLPGPSASSGEVGWQTLAAVAFTGVLALGALTLTSLRAGRLQTSSGKARRRRPIRAFVESVGVDVVLIVLGVVGLLQLRRYQGTHTTDPLVILAPTLIIAALCALCLRALPLLARLLGRVAKRTRGVPVAWGAWQVARRLREQTGAVLLILLAVAMGSLAVTQQSTAVAAVEDQTAYAAGAPFRVAPVPDLRDDPRLADTYAALSGSGAVMGVQRDSVEIGALEDVTLLSVDAEHAATVMASRPDQLRGQSWEEVVAGLTPRHSVDGSSPDGEAPAAGEVAGIPLPGEPTRLAVTGTVVDAPEHDFVEDSAARADLTAVLADADGHWFRVPLGQLTSGGTTTVSADLVPPAEGVEVLAGAGLSYPLALVGFAADYGSAEQMLFPGQSYGYSVASPVVAKLTGLAVADSAEAPSTPVEGVGDLKWGEESHATTLTSDADEVPVVVTSAVASATDADSGSTFSIGHRGVEVPVVVTAVVDSLPTTASGDAGILVDFGALQAAEARLKESPTAALVPFHPDEWWLAPDAASIEETRTALAEHPRLAADVVDRAQLRAERADGSVTAGMRGAMQLVSIAALALAAIGFAATTVTLSRLRKGESAVLAALGLSPRKLRRVLIAERVALVALTVLVGTGLGILVAWLTVPLLVTATGSNASLPILVELPWTRLALLGGGLVVGLTVVAGLTVRSVKRSDVTSTLRTGGHW